MHVLQQLVHVAGLLFFLRGMYTGTSIQYRFQGKHKDKRLLRDSSKSFFRAEASCRKIFQTRFTSVWILFFFSWRSSSHSALLLGSLGSLCSKLTVISCLCVLTLIVLLLSISLELNTLLTCNKDSLARGELHCRFSRKCFYLNN